MAGRAEGCALLSFSYGSAAGVDRDVDRFREFYRARFLEDAFRMFVKRSERASRLVAVACFVGAGFCVAPVLVNASSVFAYVILALGAVLVGAGAFFALRAARSAVRVRRDFDALMEAEFASSRSVTKRVFEVDLSEDAVAVTFGTATGVRQRRVKRYRDIEQVAVDDDLLFIKGLTWLARFQMDEADFEAACRLLEERCGDRFVRIA